MLSKEEKKDREFCAAVDGNIIAPLWGSVGLGVLGVAKLDQYKVKVLSRKRGPGIRDLAAVSKRGLEEGIVNFVKDVGLLVGPAFEKLKKAELLGGFGKEIDGLTNKMLKKEGAVENLISRAQKIIREGVLLVEDIDVWQLIHVRYVASEPGEKRSDEPIIISATRLL